MRPILGWVDPDFGGRLERLREASDEPLGVTGVGGCEYRGSRCDGLLGLAGMHDCGCHEPDSPVAVLLVVPVEEPAAEVEAVVIAGESVWEVRPVLEGLELAL